MPRVSSNISETIYDDLNREISSGQYNIGNTIPSENELAKKYNVTRFYARKALTKLEKNGLVVNIRGLGRKITRNMAKIKRVAILDHHSLEFYKQQDPSMPGHVYDWQHGLMMACSEMKRTSIYLTGESKNLADRLHHLEQVVESNVDAMVFVIGLKKGDDAVEFLEAVKKCNFPSLCFHKLNIHDKMDHFYCDDYLTGKILTEHLIENGHKKIAFISGEFESDYNYSTNFSQFRFRGFSDTLAEFGLPMVENAILPIHNYTPDWNWTQDGYTAIEILNEKKVLDEVTAIFAMNDAMAEGAIKKLEELGKRVPEDISIVGFDNDPRCKYLNLTTGEYPYAKETQRIVKKFINKLDNNEEGVLREVIKPVLLKGSTVKNIK